MPLYHQLIIIGFILEGLVFTSFLFVPKFKKLLLNNFSRSVVVILSFYLLYALFLGGEINDVRLFGSAGYHLRKGIDLYFIDQSHGTYPHFPFLAFYYALANLISEMFPFFTFSFLVKAITIPTAFLVSRFLATKEERLSFLLHPAFFGPIVIHGQADILLIFFLFFALISFQKKPVLSGVSYGLSLLVKTWSLFFLPFVVSTLKLKQRPVFLLALISTVFLDVFVYTRLLHSSFRTVFGAAFGHPGSPIGSWGLSFILSLFSIPIGPTLAKYWLIIVLVCANLVAWRKKLSVMVGIELIILCYAVLTLGWGIQYTVWLIPFAYYNKNGNWAERFGLLAIPYLMLSYFSAASGSSIEIIKIFGLLPWAYCILLLYQKLKYR